MAQRITVKIAEREYEIKAPSPESEEIIRIAASTVNKKLYAYLEKFPGKNIVDILSFVALNESINSIRLERQIEAIKKETDTLNSDLSVYLDNILEK